jgi:hypothetical protein
MRDTSARGPLRALYRRGRGSADAVLLTSVGHAAVSGVVAIRDGHGARTGPRAEISAERGPEA